MLVLECALSVVARLFLLRKKARMARRRSRGEGSVFFLDKKGLWASKLPLPDGKSRWHYGKTQKEVKDWLLKERGNLAEGSYVADDKVTVEAFLRRYLEDYGKRSLRATTYSGYLGVIERSIIPEIGHLRLTQLRAEHLNHLYGKKLSAGLSNRSVEYIHGRSCGVLSTKPSDGVSLPKTRRILSVRPK